MEKVCDAVQPQVTYMEYLKYGFCKTRCQTFFCPSCGSYLNAGPDYQPKFCSECGQGLDFTGIAYEDDVFLGFEHQDKEALA